MRLQDVKLRDTRANQPNANTVPAGTTYYVTDEQVTEQSNGTTWDDVSDKGTVADEAITNAKLAHMAEATIKGRAAGAGTGDATDLTATQATAVLDAVTGDSGAGGTKGLAPAPGAGDAAAGKFLKADATWAVPPGITALTGDISGSGSGSVATTIDPNFLKNNSVLKARVVLTNAQIQSLSTSPVTIVPAPAASEILVPVALSVLKETSAGAYSSSVSIALRYSGSAADIHVASNPFLGAAHKRHLRFAGLAEYLLGATPRLGDALVLRSSADVTGGNAANYMVVEVVYYVTADGP